VVSYAIVNKAFTKFQDGTNQLFTLAITSHVNASGFTRTDDAFCQNRSRQGLKAGSGLRLASRPLQSSDWKDVAQTFMSNVIGKVPNLTQPINDPALNNQIAELRASGPNWLHRAFATIGEWLNANKDTLLDLGFGALKMLPALLLDPQSDQSIYVDATYLKKAVRQSLNSITPLEGYKPCDRVLESLRVLDQMIAPYQGLVPADEIFSTADSSVKKRSISQHTGHDCARDSTKWRPPSQLSHERM